MVVVKFVRSEHILAPLTAASVPDKVAGEGANRGAGRGSRTAWIGRPSAR